MSRKDKFLRQCCACKGFFEKKSLVKITKTASSGNIVINPENKIYGRSVYICNNVKCITEALKKKRIETSLHSSLSETLKEELHNCTK